jgi:hypothetical protein
MSKRKSKKKKLTREQKVQKVARIVADGGWSSIYDVVDNLTVKQLDAHYGWAWEEDEEEDEDE